MLGKSFDTRNLSRPMRVGLLGGSSAMGGAFLADAMSDTFLGTTLGGSATALITNSFLDLGFEGPMKIALLGAVAAYAGRLLAQRLIPADADSVPFRGFAGLVLGGATGALSLDGIAPPELQLEG